jgi:hypothetical protein
MFSSAILTLADIKPAVFFIMTLCSLVDCGRYIGATYIRHIQCRNVHILAHRLSHQGRSISSLQLETFFLNSGKHIS